MFNVKIMKVGGVVAALTAGIDTQSLDIGGRAATRDATVAAKQ
mgnify:CR=1 FL=1